MTKSSRCDSFDGQTQISHAELHEIEITVLALDLQSPGHLFDFVTSDWLVIHVEPERLNEQARLYFERCPDPGKLFGWDEVRRRQAGYPTASFSEVATGEMGTRWQLPVDSVEQFSGEIGDLRIQIERLGTDAEDNPCEVFVLARVEGEIPRVQEILASTNLSSQNRLHLGLGCAHRGFRLRDSRMVIVGCDQVFHRTELRRRGRKTLGQSNRQLSRPAGRGSRRSSGPWHRSVSRFGDAR
jgi:transcription-repair coupling factor (superfamily II helicase)